MTTNLALITANLWKEDLSRAVALQNSILFPSGGAWLPTQVQNSDGAGYASIYCL